jgi:hypothetical protein
MGNWGKPGAIFIYSIFGAAIIYVLTPSKTIDKGLYKVYDTVTGFRNNITDSPVNILKSNSSKSSKYSVRGGSATKRHKRKSCKKH